MNCTSRTYVRALTHSYVWHDSLCWHALKRDPCVCTTLSRVAAWCGVLQCVAVSVCVRNCGSCSSVLQCAALLCSASVCASFSHVAFIPRCMRLCFLGACL